MLSGLVLAHALFLRHPTVELVQPEGLLAPGALRIGGYLRRELGSQIRWLVARQPLPQRLEGSAGGLLCFLIVGKVGEVSDLGDKLILLLEYPLSYPLSFC